MLSLETLETSKRLGIGRKIQKTIVIAVVGVSPKWHFFSMVKLFLLKTCLHIDRRFILDFSRKLTGTCTKFSLSYVYLFKNHLRLLQRDSSQFTPSKIFLRFRICRYWPHLRFPISQIH